MDSQKYKIVLIIGFILTLIVLLGIIKTQYDTIKSQEAMVEKTMVEFKELKDGTVRAQAQYTQDLEKFAKQSKINLDPIQNDIQSLNAKIVGISTILTSTPGFVGQNLGSSGTKPRDKPTVTTVPCPSGGEVVCPDVFGYQSNVQTLSLTEPFQNNLQIPLGQVEFKAWEAKPWNLTIMPRSYSVTTILGQDEDGRHYNYHKFEIKTGGKSYTVPISESKFIEQLPEAEFRFSPRIYLGIAAGARVYPELQPEIAPNVGVALFTYGQTKTNPDFTFLHLGASYNSQSNTAGIMVTPVTYNLGQHIPLIDNLHLGPAVTLDTELGVTVSGNVLVGL